MRPPAKLPAEGRMIQFTITRHQAKLLAKTSYVQLTVTCSSVKLLADSTCLINRHAIHG
jgi:hypothetical protein